MTAMKALSIKQPWANMIASGEKTIETRRWRTSYRGPLLIVSTSVPQIAPAGYALAVVDLVDCRRMTARDEIAARCERYDGAWSWVLDAVRRVEPFRVRGQLGLFDVEISPAVLTQPDSPRAPNDERKEIRPDQVSQPPRGPAWADPQVCFRLLDRAKSTRR